MIAIRQANIDDLPQLTELMRAFYPPLRAIPFDEIHRYYEWKYFDLDGRANGYPSAFVAYDSDGLAGILGCLPFTLNYQQQKFASGWVADWRLTDRARGQGIGQALLQTAVETIPVVACVEGSTDAQEVFEKLGFQAWDCARQWVYMQHILSYEWPLYPGWRKPLAFYRSAMYALARRNLPQAISVCVGAPITIDEYVRRVATHTYNGLNRDAGYLRWLIRCPQAQIVPCPIEVDGQISGCVLLQTDHDWHGRRHGRVLDLYLDTPAKTRLPEVWRAIINHLPQVDYVDAIAPLEHDPAIRANDFFETGVKRLWLKTREFTPSSSDRWLLSFVDKDNAFRGARGVF